MISIATHDEVEHVNKRIDAILEYLNMRECNVAMPYGFKIILEPNIIEENQTQASQ